MNRLSQAFCRFAEGTSRYAGKPGAFLFAAVVVVVWAATGPVFHFGDTWQLVINTGTTVVTFLMVFLIQNSQNRESSSLHIKLDELIRVTAASNGLLNLEDMDDDALDKIRAHYRRLAGRKAPARHRARKKGPAGSPEPFAEVERELKNVTASGQMSGRESTSTA
ncbi:MAG: low affinity iron permease family protein [Rhodanobacter sp.]|nr:MAG: low affinity iron permease family protein [Rhodanobacter sp.]TAM07347.1 MAG: low affinity iron permease family protein [Rhodanobacter sp.]TAM40395.1 MAG: low affinity iron permease family protein [Rhodanobacter sp.]TAN23220.1 MAG: low affinity iron permease family protein [Rhodanobacter sp.]